MSSQKERHDFIFKIDQREKYLSTFILTSLGTNEFVSPGVHPSFHISSQQNGFTSSFLLRFSEFIRKWETLNNWRPPNMDAMLSMARQLLWPFKMRCKQHQPKLHSFFIANFHFKDYCLAFLQNIHIAIYVSEELSS